MASEQRVGSSLADGTPRGPVENRPMTGGDEKTAAGVGPEQSPFVSHQGVDDRAGEQARGLPDSFGSLERLHLVQVLDSVASRLAVVEAAVVKDRDGSRGGSLGTLVLEAAKVILGGWPAFGFLFLLLFYSPLNDVLRSIPDKVRSANEIALPGLSLKSTIERVATSQGLAGLGQAIPELSSGAIDLLFKAPRRGESVSLISFTNSTDEETFTAFSLPSPDTVLALGELVERGFISLHGALSEASRSSDVNLNRQDLDRLLSQIKQRFPGHVELNTSGDRSSWRLDTPLRRDWRDRPQVMWALTESGAQAVEIVLSAVSAELARDRPTAAGETQRSR